MALKLGDIARITSGHNFRSAIDADINGNAYVIQMRDVEPGAPIALQTVHKTNIQSVRKEPEWLYNDDIIFLARGRENFAIHLEDIPANTVCTSHFFVIQVHDPQYLPGFVSWQLNQLPLQEYFKKNSAGAMQRHITASVLKNAELTYVETELQQSIIDLNNLSVRERQIYLELINNRQQQLVQLSQHILGNTNL